MNKYFLIFGYVLSILLANIFLDTFIPLPIFGQLSVGTIFFAAIFTLRDRLHTYGIRLVFLAIFLALVVNVAYSIAFGVPARFIFASFFAILLSELTDTLVFQKLRAKSWALRVISSNAISVPLDSIIFSLIAFWGVMSVYEISEIVFADIFFKFIISVLMIYPTPYLLKTRHS